MFNKPLSIELKPSLVKQLLIIAPHILSTFVLFWVLHSIDFPVLGGLLTLGGIAISAIYYFRLHIIQTLKSSIHWVSVDANNKWTLTFHKGNAKKAVLCPTSFISNQLIIINFKTDNKKRYSVLITPDSTSKEDYRRVKVMLKVENFNKN